MKFAAAIVAAGRGVRFGRPKQLVEVAGRPLVAWSMSLFGEMPELDDLIVATEPEHVATMEALAATYAPRMRAIVVLGGATRRESVRNAIAAVPAECDALLVHDGARPLVLADDVRAGMAATRPGTGALLAVPVVDTIKVVERDGARVRATLDRSELWAAQTPQFGTLDDLRRAHAAAGDAEATDDAMLLEHIGCDVVVVRTSSENFKVTVRGDRDPRRGDPSRTHLARGEAMSVRIGHGFDAHRLVEGRPFILGGVAIPYERGPLGHSDADVLAHALSDALLGACALGDLGKHFPDTDARWKGADSMQLLEACAEMVRERGYALTNVDATVVVQEPKLAPHLDRIRAGVAAALRIETDAVSVKAKTSEGMGYTGDGTGIAAYAVAALTRSP